MSQHMLERSKIRLFLAPVRITWVHILVAS